MRSVSRNSPRIKRIRFTRLKLILFSGLNETNLQTQALLVIKDGVEVVNTPEFRHFLQQLFPLLRELLYVTVYAQFEDTLENKVRALILEIFLKFPTTNELKAVALDLIAICMKVINEDNEGNAIIAIKILFDVHKAFRPNLEAHVQVR
jgi:transformation/transcription domain-associated protein